MSALYRNQLEHANDLIEIGRGQGALSALNALTDGFDRYNDEYKRKVELKSKEESNG